MARDGLGHWKTGLAFLGGCIAIGVLLAVPSGSQDSESRDTGDLASTDGVESSQELDSPIEPEDVSSENPSSPSTNDREQVPWDELSYQEQLKRSGDVDGRTKDYFTPDGDGEFGGAVVGMDYADFRDRLRYAGFEPLAVSPRWRCETDSGFKPDCNYQYPETQSCDDNNEAVCRYLWTNGDSDYMVVTKGGEGGQVTKMSHNR